MRFADAVALASAEAIALRQYFLRQHEDGWRLVHIVSTVDGPRDGLCSDAEIRGGAEQVLAFRDGPAQRDLPWRPGPTTAGSHTLIADVVRWCPAGRWDGPAAA